MKTAFLHLGFHKTGTTSFQNDCHANTILLSEQNTSYPSLHNFHNPSITSTNHSIALLTAFASDPKKYPKKLGKRIEQGFALKNNYHGDFRLNLETENDLILSGEDIGALDHEDLYSLRSEIHSFGFNIKAIAIVRSPYSFHCSVTQESINNGNHFIDFNKKGIDRRSEYITKLLEVFENQIEFYPFEAAKLHTNGPSGFLAEKIGTKIKHHASPTTHSNQGINNLRTRVKNVLNRKTVPLNLGHNETIRLLNAIEDNQPFLLTNHELEINIKEFELENQKLHKLVGPQFCDTQFPTAANLDFNQISSIIASILQTSQG